jgi:hypothetical protein
VGEAKKEGRWNGAKPRKGRKWGNSPFLTALKKKIGLRRKMLTLRFTEKSQKVSWNRKPNSKNPQERPCESLAEP